MSFDAFQLLLLRGIPIKRTLLLAAASVVFASVQAIAADVPKRVVVAPVVPTYWADLLLFGGWEATVDHFNTCSDLAGSVIGGEARFGWMHAPGQALQLDIHGTSDKMKGTGCNTGSEDDAAVFGAAAHWTFLTAPTHSLGVMAAISNWQENPRWYTIAAEGVAGLGPVTRLTVQAGWSTSRESGGPAMNAPYIHAVLDHMINPNLMLSGNLGFARPDSDEGPESVWRFGAKLEMAFNPAWSGFVEWQGIHRTEADDPADKTDNNRLLIGARLRLNSNGSLMSVSPLHDFSWPSGVNNQFEF